MTNFEVRLQELGLSVNELSIKLKNEIAEFYKMQEIVNDLADNEVEKETFDNATEQLQEADIELVNKINKFDKNKNVYRERAIKMQQARGYHKKNEQKLNNVNSEQQRNINYNYNAEQIPIKKKNDMAFWVLAGIVGIITLGGVIMNKNK
jgi:uncharacterized membrane protein